MTDDIKIGERVEVFLDQKFGDREGWYAGTVFKIDPYSNHRSFYWVRFDEAVANLLGIQQISVFNPKNLRKVE